MISLPSIIPVELRPADMQALWDTAVIAGADDETPWLILADFCDDHGWHGLAAACRHPRGNWFDRPDTGKDWSFEGMAVLLNKSSGWWAVRVPGEVQFAYDAHWPPHDWKRAEPVLRGEGMAG